MRTLSFVCAIAIFIAVFTTGAYARVIAGNLENGVAVYYFNSLTNSGNVLDYSGNGLHGALLDGAQLSTVSGRQCLSVDTNAAIFQASNDNKSLSISKEFSIVAWVKVPQQRNVFLIQIYTYNTEYEGSIDLGVGTDDLFGAYTYDDDEGFYVVSTTGRNVNNNQWHHIGFVVNSTAMKLYLNGNRVANLPISVHQSFAGAGSFVWIGESARGSVDDVGLFKNDLTDAQIRLIYNQGLANIINIASVDPGGKVTTTWGALKQK